MCFAFIKKHSQIILLFFLFWDVKPIKYVLKQQHDDESKLKSPDEQHGYAANAGQHDAPAEAIEPPTIPSTADEHDGQPDGR